MKRYDPDRHHRRSIRLKGYDYSQEGLYFITLCCQNRACLFGEVRDGKMVLNEAGNQARLCWQAIPEHFPNVVLHAFVIMPNHVHGILEIVDRIGAKDISSEQDADDVMGAKDISPERDANENNDSTPPKGTSKTVGSIVRGFKIGVTKWMRQNTNVHDVWQRNYYEIIIRNATAYEHISNYIATNPERWEGDRFHMK